MFIARGIASTVRGAKQAAAPALRSGAKTSKTVAKTTARATDEAADAAKLAAKSSRRTKLATGAVAALGVGGAALYFGGAVNEACESLFGEDDCKVLDAPRTAFSALTGLPAQIADWAVTLIGGAMVVATAYLAYNGTLMITKTELNPAGNSARAMVAAAGAATGMSLATVGILNASDA